MTKMLFLIALSVISALGAKPAAERIQRYAGQNAQGLLDLYENSKYSEHVRFILDNSSPADLSLLTPDYIEKNVEYALKTKEFKYASLYDEDIFNHFVLPLRSTQEPFEDWRERFYYELHPVLKDIEDIEKAAILVNLWYEEQMTYKSTHGKDQGPLTSIKRGYGRCEEMMILYMSAARSVGIPVRSAGTPLWNFTDSNHAWVEVWTPEGWRYLGEPSDRLNSTWFTPTTKRATLITSRAFGVFEGDDVIGTTDISTEISSIRYYSDKWDRCEISVTDSAGLFISDAEIIIYGFSWGGLFPMHRMRTDENGIAVIPLGKGTVYLGAYHQNYGTGFSLFDTTDGQTSVSIALSNNGKIEKTGLNFRFQIAPQTSSENGERRFFEGRFDLMRENASLKRQKRLLEYRKTAEFAEYFLKSRKYQNSSDFYGSKKEFLDKCDRLGGNTQTFLKAYKGADILPVKDRPGVYSAITDIILNWDIKELCEIPDSASVKNAAVIYSEGKKRYGRSVPDTIFAGNVIAPTWSGAQPVQNGWQKELYEQINHLAVSNISNTVKNAVEWVDSKLEEDTLYTGHYYSSHQNPLDLINMKHVSPFGKTKLTDAVLTTLGIPTRWRGSLEFYNGKEFVPVAFDEKSGDEKAVSNSFKLKIFVDSVQVKAEPWRNFLMSELEEGTLRASFFDGENDSLSYIVNYPFDRDKKLYVQAGIRNSNGDANIHIIPVDGTEEELSIYLETPREYLDLTDDFDKSSLEKITDFIKEKGIGGLKILLVRGVIPNEPTRLMTDLLIGRTGEYAENNAVLVIHTELRTDNDLPEIEGTIRSRGDIIISDMPDEYYPLVFIIDENEEIIFASKGYNLNIADLILKRIKNY